MCDYSEGKKSMSHEQMMLAALVKLLNTPIPKTVEKK